MKLKPGSRRIAFFISPHGYGHAARAAAVMGAIHGLDHTIEFDIFTQVPRWFFKDSLSARFIWHSYRTDIGLVQETPLRAQIKETLSLLKQFLPFESSKIEEIASILRRRKCDLVVCDIAPIGILAAKEACIPSVLVENFTWDWIYEQYLKEEPRMGDHIPYLSSLFDMADLHIQTEPVCRRRSADLTTPPVSRKPKKPPHKIREALGISNHSKAVVITMGGVPTRYPFLRDLAKLEDTYFIIPGASRKAQFQGSLLLLPRHSKYYHPDLIQASDAVIGKVGYSTLAEVYRAGVPFGYIARSAFRESQVLESFVEKEMKGISIKEEEFNAGTWVSHLPDILALPRTRPQGPDGASMIAQFLSRLERPGPLKD